MHSASGWLWKDAVLATSCTFSAELFMIWRSVLKRKEGRKVEKKESIGVGEAIWESCRLV